MVYKILNPTMNALLKSPLHRVLSGCIMTVSYLGRRSGKLYATPVSYYKTNDKVYCFTNGVWWNNFRESRAVELRIRGEMFKGTAIAAPASTGANTQIMADYFRAVRSDAKFYGVRYDADGYPLMSTVERAACGMVMITTSLNAS